ncbi:MAG: hypothetical protein ABI870_00185 [Rhodanobacter sp.]
MRRRPCRLLPILQIDFAELGCRLDQRKRDYADLDMKFTGASLLVRLRF